ncbi:polyprenyl synthetase family protein [Streptomyces sp. NBC_00435]|uniref:polyprenyl synthetase family protein n=1 Tax=Streptomyces sp. NBC_00435 TaxID=2903649 RepID=UPI002E1F311F
MSEFRHCPVSIARIPAGLSAPSRSVGEFLAAASGYILPSMQRAVSTLPEEIRNLAGIHFGWWDAAGDFTDGPAGKAVRPALTLAVCQAMGGAGADALPAAVAVELVHNASLIHDDLIDRDATRHGRPTIWHQFGLPAAVLTGDALFFLAIDTLRRGSPALAGLGVTRLTLAVQALIGGEYHDTLLEGQILPILDDVISMTEAKTSVLIAEACALGAIAADACPERVAHLYAFGLHLGSAFQLVDDLLGIWGESATTGKPIWSDLRSRKKSLPVAAALTSDHPAASTLRRLYSQHGAFTENQLVEVAALIDEAGGRRWAATTAEDHIGKAMTHLQDASAAPGPAAELSALARHIAHRDH